MKFFDVIFYIKAKKSIRLKRFKSKGGERRLFNILNQKQLSDTQKIKFSDHVIVNDKDESIKKNRLELIQMLCKTFDNYISFSKIESI